MEISRVPGLTPQQLACLRKAGVSHAAEVLTLGETLLMHVLGLSFAAARDLVERVGEHVSPTVSTALESLQRSRSSATRLSTPLPSLNAVLPNRALPPVISEFCGPAGAGKTQWCFSLAAIVASGDVDGSGSQFGDGGGVIYIDTEDTFSAERLQGVLCARYPEQFSDSPHPSHARHRAALAAALGRVTVYRETTSKGLTARLSGLEDVIIARNVRLLILDSVAALARRDWDAGDTDEIRARADLLARQASALKQIADTFCMPVVVTNQITSLVRRGGSSSSSSSGRFSSVSAALEPASTSGGSGTNDAAIDDQLVPALGNTWAHCVSNRFYLENTGQSDPNFNLENTGGPNFNLREASVGHNNLATRWISIVKSVCAPNARMQFTVSTAGVSSWQPS